MQSNLNQVERYKALDGIRGLAAVIVIVSHCANAGLLPAYLGKGFGMTGVSLFYALSGFLMGHLYLYKPFSQQTIFDYIRRRAARVLPLFYFAVLVGLIMSVWEYAPYQTLTGENVLLSVFLVQGTGVLWSIPVEIQFYMVFLLIWWAAASGRLYVALGGLLALQALTICAVLFVWGKPSTYILLLWVHVFLFGVALGDLTKRYDLKTFVAPFRKKLNVVCVGLLLMLVILPPGIRLMLGIPTTHTFVDPISLGLPLTLLVAGILKLGPTRLFETPPMQWLGKISFGAYLLHMPVLVVVQPIIVGNGVAPFFGALAVFGLTLLFAALSLRILEVPAQRFILNWSSNSVAHRVP